MYTEPDTNWFSTAILNSIDGFFDWSTLSGHISLSASFKNFLGYTRSELNKINKEFFSEYTHGDDRDRVHEEFSSFFKSLKNTHTSEFRLRAKSGDYVWVHINGKAQRDDLGTCHRFAAVVKNIDGYKNDIDKMAKLSESKSKFIASLNHELRSPLASIMGIANLMMDEDISENHKKFMGNIISSADMLMNLVNDILDISKIAAGKLSLENRPIHFRELLSQVHEIVRPQQESKNIFFCIKNDLYMPEYILTDSTRMKQVLLNLCTNAIKFTKTGGIFINTKYTPINNSSGKLYVEVVDSGIGIPEDRIDLLFQDFTQADITTTRQYGGTGLGLAICRKIIGLMGGNISVNSEPNVGSTFWFEIPVEVALQNQDTKDASPQKNTSPPKEKTSLKDLTPNEPSTKTYSTSTSSNKKGHAMNTSTSLDILVAEDNMVNQAVMQGLLEKLGHKVTIAEDGLEAVQCHGQGNFDLILMDINMPNMNGIEACQKIRETDKKIPIIAVTANTLEEEKQKCLAAGMNQFATKPVSKEKLLDLLKEFVDKKQAANPGIAPSVVSETKPVSTAPASEIIYVDTASLKQLISDLGNSRITKFVELYKNDAPRLIENIKGNVDVETSAHTLAGMSENLNFTALGKLSRSILTMTKSQNDANTLKEKANTLPGIYEETMKAVEILLSQA